MKSVVFALRSDSTKKQGGDARKVEKYRPGLEQRGFRVEVVNHVEELRASKAQVVQIMNLDLPVENWIYGQAAKQQGKKIVLSSIRHPFKGLELLYEHGDDWLFNRFSRMHISPDRGFLLRECLKLGRRGSYTRPRRSLGFQSAQRELLRHTDAVLPMARGEMVGLKRDFEHNVMTRIIPNGFSANSHDSNRRKQFEVAVVGRIEPRKNSVNTLRALAKLKTRAVFIGALNPNHAGYAKAFLDELNSCPSVTYLGRVDQASVGDILATTETYVNAAWCEVVSQADIEAASWGCRIVTTRYGYTAEYLEGNVATIDPMRLLSDDAADYLQAAIDESSRTANISLPSWDKAASDLAEVYEEVLDGKK